MFDIPLLRYEVTEHQVLEARCTCGKVHRGEFPNDVTAPVQYGARIKATVVHLTHHHMMPVARTGETGMRVADKLHWPHVLATPAPTWLGNHVNRCKEAFDAFGVLIAFTGTLVHDGWKSYRDLACAHALCNAHHLRELTYLAEEMKQDWAPCLIGLLVEACHEVKVCGGPLTEERIAHYRSAYAGTLADGEAQSARPAVRQARYNQAEQSAQSHRPLARPCR